MKLFRRFWKDKSALAIRLRNTVVTQRTLRSRGLIFWSLYPLYLLVLAGGGVGAYGVIQWGVDSASAAKGGDVWSSFYQELDHSGVRAVSSQPDDRHIDVLLLGGSVLEQVGPDISSRLHARLGEQVRVFNLARSAHTSRDSLLKYRRIRDRAFDLIVIYDGINDVRMNCCADELFRDDYTHCGWYNSIQRRTSNGSMKIAPLALTDLQRLIDLGRPRTAKQLDLGDVIKTPPAFAKNIQEIVESAAGAGQPVLLMTFAYHLPDGYTRERFEQGELEFGAGDYRFPVELWGKPRNVAKTPDAQNAAIRQISAAQSHVIFCDLQTELPRTGTIFSDVCHLTATGCQEFVERLMHPLGPWLDEMRTKHHD
jgi:hypothetical protein